MFKCRPASSKNIFQNSAKPKIIQEYGNLLNILEVWAIRAGVISFQLPIGPQDWATFFARGLQSLIVSDPLRGPIVPSNSSMIQSMK